MNKTLTVVALAIAVIALMPLSSASMFNVDHNLNKITTGDMTWKIERNYLSKFMDVKITEINDSCFLVETKPQQKLLDIYKESKSMSASGFLNKYSYLKKQGRNIIADVKTIDKIPFGSLNGFTRGKVKKQIQGGTFSGLEQNSFEICGTKNKGNSFSFGFGTTTATVEDSLFLITIDPATSYCVYDCDIRITIHNKDSVPHDLYLDNITIENPENMRNADFDYKKLITESMTVNDYGIVQVFYPVGEINLSNSTDCQSFNSTHDVCNRWGINGTKVIEKQHYERSDFLHDILQPNEDLMLYLNYDVPEGSYGKYNITFFIDGQYYNIDPWWNSSFPYCRNFTINSDMITEDLQNFPLMLKLNSSRIDYSNTQDSGQDFRVIDAPCGEAGNTLPYEIEIWNESGDSIIWFNTSLSSSTDKTYSYYYGNPSASDAQDIANVWDSNYYAVWHMGDIPGNTSGILDSTNNINMSKRAANEPLQTNGDIGYSQDFDALNDFAQHSNINLDNFTMEVFAISPNTVVNQYVIGTDAGGPNCGDAFIDLGQTLDNEYTGNLDRRGCAEGDDLKLSSGTVSTNTYYFVSVIGNATANGLFLDGELKANNGAFPYFGDSGSVFFIGGIPYADTAAPFYGKIDEARLSDTVRSPAWINATYYCLKDEIITYGSESFYAPQISITNPLNITYSDTFNLNVTVDRDVDSCLYNIDGGSNSTLNNDSLTNWFTEVTPSSDGTHNIIVYCNSTDGIWGVNDTVWFTYDTTGPVIIITNPENETYSVPLDLNVTTLENADSCIYNIDGGTNISLLNDSLTNWFEIITPASQGTKHLFVYCNDTFLNSALNDSVWFSYITTVFVSPTPANNSIVTTNNMTINVSSLTENMTSCQLDIDGANHTMTVEGSYCYTDYQFPSIGNYEYKVYYTTDVFGDWVTETRTVTSAIAGQIEILAFDERTLNPITDFDVRFTDEDLISKTFSNNKSYSGYYVSDAVRFETQSGLSNTADGDFSTYSTLEVTFASTTTVHYSGISGFIDIQNSDHICMNYSIDLDNSASRQVIISLLLRDDTGTMRTINTTTYTWATGGTNGFVAECWDIPTSYSFDNIAEWYINTSYHPGGFTGGNSSIQKVSEIYNDFNTETNKITIQKSFFNKIGDYIILANEANGDYYSREYTEEFTTDNNITLSVYLPKKTDSIVQPIFAVQTAVLEQPVSGATVTIQKNIGGTYVPISVLTTDDSGTASARLIELEYYRIIVQYQGYTTSGSIQAIATTYRFSINESLSIDFDSVLNDIYVAISPDSIAFNVSDSSYNVNFSYFIITDNGTLDLFGMRLLCNGTVGVFAQNVTTSPTGGTITHEFDVSPCDNITLEWWYKKSGFDLYWSKVEYGVSRQYPHGLNLALNTATANVDSETLNWVVVIVFIIVMSGLTLFSPEIAGVAAIVLGGIFSWVGMMSWSVYLLIVIVLLSVISIKRRWI